jgi:hypothetical protein
MRDLTLRGIVAWFGGLASGAAVCGLLAILGGCGTVHGIASDLEVGARACKQATAEYRNVGERYTEQGK